MVSDAQKAANMRLQAKRDRVVIWLDKDGTKDKIRARAHDQGLSVNAYVLGLIQRDICDGK